MEKIKNNIELILYLIVTIILTIIMFWAIEKKEGFHEDEMFSYGASNSTLGNTFLSYGRIDNIDSIIKRRNPFLTLKNYIYYKVIKPEAYDEEVKKLDRDDFKSVWRNKEDATEYLQIDNFAEAVDLVSVYWNTAKDVHPPLFYLAVHIVSIVFWGHFSKYIIFYVNLVFFLATLWILRKIFILIDKKYLSVANLIIYGASIGAISTVMFQRMYMMLTFFTVWLLYVNLKIFYNNFELTKELKRELILVTILGFLTQYNFCIYAAFLALVMICMCVAKKQKNNIKPYILQFVKSAIIGILVFLPSIYHIFFSYRGIGGDATRTFTMYESLKTFSEHIFNSFSLSLDFGLDLAVLLLIVFIWKYIASDLRNIYTIVVFPAVLTFLVIVATSPYKSLRYVMFLLPIVAMGFLLLLDDLIDNKKFSSILLTAFTIYLSVYGILTKPINYLYIGYQEYVNIARTYEDDRFVVVTPTVFSQIKDMLEYKIYKETLMIAPDKLEDLKDFKEFENEDEFILGVKNWIDTPEEDVLNEVMIYTGFENYELIHSSTKSARLSVYRLYK